MEMVREHLDTIGERTLFLNLDIEWDRPHFESQAAPIKKIELELGKIDRVAKHFLTRMSSYVILYDGLYVMLAL
jgi:hypothetical protein